MSRAYCPHCPCSECRRAQDRGGPKLPDARPPEPSRPMNFCGTCNGLIGGNWSTGGCTCHLNRGGGSSSGGNDGGYGPNHF